MAKLEWHQAVKVMLKNVVKVSTLGNGYGSGVIVPTLLSVNRHYVPGVEFGWLGYPVLEIAKNTPCFLHGRVSAYLDDVEAYLVDGFSIHGVSGGPVFCCEENGDLVLAGIVTNYFPNQITIPNSGTQSWPGLAMFRTVNPLMKLYAQENKVKPQQLPPITATSYK